MIPGAPTIEELSSSSTLNLVCSALALPPSTPKTELSYELVRAVTWASTGGRTPVSTRTLLDRAMDADAALHDGSLDQHVRRQFFRARLDDLAAVGDLAALGRGQWVSATGSVVSIDSSGNRLPHLLVSGIPNRIFPSTVRHTLRLSGHTRIVERVDDIRPAGLPVIGLDAWARIPDLPLEEWTTEVLDAPLAKLEETAGTVRVYLPGSARPESRQSGRWFAPRRDLEGRYLARHNVLGEWSGFSVVELAAGTVVGHRELDPLHVRRLMYGLDHRAGNHTVAIVGNTSDYTRIRLGNPLPPPETRVLLALCGFPTQDSWTVRHHADAVLANLRALHIPLRTTR